MPAATSSKEIPVREYVARFSPDVRKIIEAARNAVKAQAPKARERAWQGWPIRYDLDGATFAAVMGQASYVNLVLSDGAALPDPKGLLEGTGKSLRHVKLRAASDAASPGVKRLLAHQLQATRRARKAMP